ncbi:PIN domain-containing protein [Gryllotalpicola koreensis]|uniref:Ribonuclease VapC n=1 Tax=Gryllotalpicola koreensis TaxID=993086 RepID=A0ABP8A3H0_9MICO
MTVWIIDNSIWARDALDAAVHRRVDALLADPSNLVISCPPQALEYCFSARDIAHYELLRDEMELLARPRYTPDLEDVLSIQQALFEQGTGRGVGVIDILIAAWALVNRAAVLTADRDFDLIARAVPEFLHEYVPGE